MLPGPLPVPQCCSGPKSHRKVHRAGHAPRLLAILIHFLLPTERQGGTSHLPCSPLEAGLIRGPALLSSPLPTQFYPGRKKPHSMQINHSTAHEQQLCPIPSLSRAAGTLQPVYPDFKQQLQLLQHCGVSRNSSTEEVKEHTGQLRCRAKALAARWMQQSQRRGNVLQGRSLCPAPGKVPPAGGSHSQHQEWLLACSNPASVCQLS